MALPGTYGAGFWLGLTCNQVLALPLTSCVASGISPNFCKPQFPHLWTGSNHYISAIEIWGRKKWDNSNPVFSAVLHKCQHWVRASRRTQSPLSPNASSSSMALTRLGTLPASSDGAEHMTSLRYTLIIVMTSQAVWVSLFLPLLPTGAAGFVGRSLKRLPLVPDPVRSKIFICFHSHTPSEYSCSRYFCVYDITLWGVSNHFLPLAN